MGSSEKFCLRWNDFESNISVAFREIRNEKDFFDVTLACGDRQIQAHKLILSACSPFFRGVLRRNPHAHPLLYLKGVDYSDLQAVLDFMYHGEVNVAQEELNSFLAVAEDLKVKGLTQNNQNSSSGSDIAPRDLSKPKTDSTPRPRPDQDFSDRGDRDTSTGSPPKKSRSFTSPPIPTSVHTPVPPPNFSNNDIKVQEEMKHPSMEPPTLHTTSMEDQNMDNNEGNQSQEEEFIQCEDSTPHEPILQKIRGFNLYFEESNTTDREEAYMKYKSLSEDIKQKYIEFRIPGDKEGNVYIPSKVKMRTHKEMSCFEYEKK